MSSESFTGPGILLCPRPYEQHPGKLLLVPLLPHRKVHKPLPAEIWMQILAFSLSRSESIAATAVDQRWGWSLVRVCKSFCEIALPLLYGAAQISRIESLELFYKRLHTADQKWDSIRRIPYSTPGRWVQSIDLSELVFQGQLQAVLLDSLLTRLFPLTPFLSTLSVNPSFVLSRNCLFSLAYREEAVHIRSLTGLSYVPPVNPDPEEDPFVKLLRSCPNIEELCVVGQGLDPAELEFDFSGLSLPSLVSFNPLRLPKLRLLSLLSMHSSPFMIALLNSPLPGLYKLTITPYDDIPYPASLVSKLIATHGKELSSILLLTPKSWPTRLHPSPSDILLTSPNLNHLSLENPLPNLTLPPTKHPLKILSIPRPTADFWPILERMLPSLPKLIVLRARDVRWLRKGISSRALEAGVQGEMREWQRRLARRGIRVLDADWNSPDGE